MSDPWKNNQSARAACSIPHSKARVTRSIHPAQHVSTFRSTSTTERHRTRPLPRCAQRPRTSRRTRRRTATDAGRRGGASLSSRTSLRSAASAPSRASQTVLTQPCSSTTGSQRSDSPRQLQSASPPRISSASRVRPTALNRASRPQIQEHSPPPHPTLAGLALRIQL